MSPSHRPSNWYEMTWSEQREWEQRERANDGAIDAAERRERRITEIIRWASNTDELRKNLSQGLDQVEALLHASVDRMREQRAELSDEIERLSDELRTERDELRRHRDVLVQLVAEALEAIDEQRLGDITRSGIDLRDWITSAKAAIAKTQPAPDEVQS